MKSASQFRVRAEFWLQLLVLTVGAHGLFVIAITLSDQLAGRGALQNADFDIPLLIGLGLTYLSALLRRRKQTAWFVAMLAYIFMLGIYAHRISLALAHHDILEILTKLVLPIMMVSLLLAFRRQFTVRSDTRSFAFSLRVTVLVLAIALVYGVVGFTLLDKHDFHQEISLQTAVDRTFDQFGLITSDQLVPHTRRAKVFVNSLSVISIGSLVYAALSLFQPIRARVTSEHNQLEHAQKLLAANGGNSEDFFKLWPNDKSFHFTPDGNAGLAYRKQSRFALIVGDPFGDGAQYSTLLRSFQDVCYGNDWTPVWVHVAPTLSNLYEKFGYSLQKIGEEAIVDIATFQTTTKKSKYFRQINNKFQREGYVTEVLLPPHHKAVVARLQTISDEWLTKPGRAERGFMMGYFSEEYMQQCQLIIARDPAGTIQGFLNMIPSPDAQEANFDLLRHASGAIGNINDFLLQGFINEAERQGNQRVNLGLSPLAGLDDLEDKSIVSRALRVLYSNGDRFYSFSGLQRFKAKYEPEWSDRYVAYQGNPTVFVRAMNALARALRVRR